jgi:hypothetical protein
MASIEIGENGENNEGGENRRQWRKSINRKNEISKWRKQGEKAMKKMAKEIAKVIAEIIIWQ